MGHLQVGRLGGHGGDGDHFGGVAGHGGLCVQAGGAP